MPSMGRVAFTRMEEVVFGMSAAAAAAQLVKRFGARRVFVMASGTLNRETQEVARIRSALGERCCGLFDRMPAHTPRAAVLQAAQAAREARADLIACIGGGSVTDGTKAVAMCLAHDVRDDAGLDALRSDASGVQPRAVDARVVPLVAIPTTLSGGEFSPSSA
jgi:maleylacetate reductase